MNGAIVDIDIWRARVPSDFSCHPVPMIRVTVTPKALIALSGDVDLEDDLDARHRTYIWFRDQKGWRSAWRLARLIAGGRLINKSLIQAEPGDVLVRAAAAHFAEAVTNKRKVP